MVRCRLGGRRWLAERPGRISSPGLKPDHSIAN